MWITCRWLNLSQVTNWESATTYVLLLLTELVVGSSPWSPQSLLLWATRSSESEICEIGEQGGPVVRFGIQVCILCWKISRVTTGLQLTIWWTPERESNCFVVVTIVRCTPRNARTESSYLVDPASSHMLVSKIKPCMSKYKQIYTVKLRMAH
jgi:hypothetical protein